MTEKSGALSNLFVQTEDGIGGVERCRGLEDGDRRQMKMEKMMKREK